MKHGVRWIGLAAMVALCAGCGPKPDKAATTSEAPAGGGGAAAGKIPLIAIIRAICNQQYHYRIALSHCL